MFGLGVWCAAGRVFGKAKGRKTVGGCYECTCWAHRACGTIAASAPWASVADLAGFVYPCPDRKSGSSNFTLLHSVGSGYTPGSDRFLAPLARTIKRLHVPHIPFHGHHGLDRSHTADRISIRGIVCLSHERWSGPRLNCEGR